MEISLELRSVNSRYLDLRFRLPKEAQNLEAPIRERVQSVLSRGRVELALELVMRSENPWQLNEALLRSYQQAATRAAELGVAGDLTVGQILQLPGILEPTQLNLAPEELQRRVIEALDEALEQLLEARCREGQALSVDLGQRLSRMSELVHLMGALAVDLTALYRDKLEKRISALLTENTLDQGRLAQEVCYYAERSDITEELTRLSSHLVRFQELIRDERDGQLGRNLDFLCQEMNREINTIASKASQATLSEFAVEGKVEIEKIREQVQNIE